MVLEGGNFHYFPSKRIFLSRIRLPPIYVHQALLRLLNWKCGRPTKAIVSPNTGQMHTHGVKLCMDVHTELKGHLLERRLQWRALCTQHETGSKSRSGGRCIEQEDSCYPMNTTTIQICLRKWHFVQEPEEGNLEIPLEELTSICAQSGTRQHVWSLRNR